MTTVWKIHCKYDKYDQVTGHEDLWQCWLKEGIVTIGWPPGRGFYLHGKLPTVEKHGWSRIRNRLKKLSKGDYIIAALSECRIGRMGQITNIEADDHEWNPKVPEDKDNGKLRSGEQGRIIHVKWLPIGPTHEGVVVKVTKDDRKFTRDEYNAALSKIKSKDINDLNSIMEDKDCWVTYKAPRKADPLY